MTLHNIFRAGGADTIVTRPSGLGPFSIDGTVEFRADLDDVGVGEFLMSRPWGIGILLLARFSFQNLRFGKVGRPQRRLTSRRGYLIAGFPPQHHIEQAFLGQGSQVLVRKPELPGRGQQAVKSPSLGGCPMTTHAYPGPWAAGWPRTHRNGATDHSSLGLARPIKPTSLGLLDDGGRELTTESSVQYRPSKEQDNEWSRVRLAHPEQPGSVPGGD